MDIKETTKYDAFIIEVFLQPQNFTDSEITKLNYCQMFLKVTVIADITTTDRKSIKTNCAQYPPKQQMTSMKWPQQKMPNPTTWRL
eukprot:816539-Ditylum_brightwellii.AAC.1